MAPRNDGALKNVRKGLKDSSTEGVTLSMSLAPPHHLNSFFLFHEKSSFMPMQ
jgi:hypothetical protein